MKKNIKLDNYIVDIYYENNYKKVPVIILNSFDDDGEKIYDLVSKKKNFILVNISNLNWNDDLSCWYMDSVFPNGEPFGGKADVYLDKLINKIIPSVKDVINNLNIKISYYAIAGYSLAGLFALYSIYKTNIFDRVMCASSSFWFNNFKEYVLNNKPYKVSKIYFSLGDKEHLTKNKEMNKVLDNTITINEYFSSLDVLTIFEKNEGNHFSDVNLRISKGINWILD